MSPTEYFLDPAAAAVSVYPPGETFGNKNVPASADDTVFKTVPVPAFVSKISTAGTTAPVASDTDPRITPATFCAKLAVAANTIHTPNNQVRVIGPLVRKV